MALEMSDDDWDDVDISHGSPNFPYSSAAVTRLSRSEPSPVRSAAEIEREWEEKRKAARRERLDKKKKRRKRREKKEQTESTEQQNVPIIEVQKDEEDIQEQEDKSPDQEDKNEPFPWFGDRILLASNLLGPDAGEKKTPILSEGEVEVASEVDDVDIPVEEEIHDKESELVEEIEQINIKDATPTPSVGEVLEGQESEVEEVMDEKNSGYSTENDISSSGEVILDSNNLLRTSATHQIVELERSVSPEEEEEYSSAFENESTVMKEEIPEEEESTVEEEIEVEDNMSIQEEEAMEEKSEVNEDKIFVEEQSVRIEPKEKMPMVKKPVREERNERKSEMKKKQRTSYHPAHREAVAPFSAFPQEITHEQNLETLFYTLPLPKEMKEEQLELISRSVPHTAAASNLFRLQLEVIKKQLNSARVRVDEVYRRTGRRKNVYTTVKGT